MQEEELPEERLRYFYPTLPNNERKLTDVLCLVVYSLLTLTVLIAFFYSFILEKDKFIITPKDSDGRMCGSGQAEEYPYIYFVSPATHYFGRAVCVKQCPNSQQSQMQCLKNSQVDSCRSKVTGNPATEVSIYTTEKNEFLKLCQPETKLILASLDSYIDSNWLMAGIEKISKSYVVILVACPLITIFLTLIYVIALNKVRDITGVLILNIVLFHLGLFLIAGFSFTPSAHRTYYKSHILGYVLATVALLSVIYLLVRRKYLMRGIKVMNIATEYIRNNWEIILISLWLILTWACLLFLQLIFILFIYSLDADQPTKQNYVFAYGKGKQSNVIVQILLGLTTFHYLWTNIILYHCGKYICRAAASNWIMHVPNHFNNSLFTLFKFHIGSVLQGASYITLFSWISSLLYLVIPDSKDRTCCCCVCPKLRRFYESSFFTQWLSFLNEQNYLVVSLDGIDFCAAGRRMTPLYLENMQHVERAHFMAKIVSFMSKILVVILTGILCELIILSFSAFQNHMLINIIILIFSFLLSSFMFDSYNKSYETLLLTILFNNDHKLRVLDKIGLSPFAKVDSDEIREQVYTKIESWYLQEKSIQDRAKEEAIEK